MSDDLTIPCTGGDTAHCPLWPCEMLKLIAGLCFGTKHIDQANNEIIGFII